MDKTRKPRIVVENGKGKVEWIEHLSSTTSQLCRQCDFNFPTFPKPDKPVSSVKELYTQLIELFMDWDDAIVFCGETIEPTWVNLAKSIDHWLLGYFCLQYDLQYGKEIPVPAFYTDYVATLLKYKDRPSKSWRLWAPEIKKESNPDNRVVVCPAFATKAQLTLLAQRLFLRRDASRATHAPEHTCCFYGSAMLRNLKKYEFDFQDSSNLTEEISMYLFQEDTNYTLEDYILFERVTACSFFIEVAGALSCIEQEQRDICLEVLTMEQNLICFLSCPYLLTRIAIARQFIFEAASLLQRQFKNVELFGETLHQAECRAAQGVIDLMLKELLPSHNEPACFLTDVECSSKERCRDILSDNIINTTAPIDLGKYMKNPKTIIFCSYFSMPHE